MKTHTRANRKNGISSTKKFRNSLMSPASSAAAMHPKFMMNPTRRPASRALSLLPAAVGMKLRKMNLFLLVISVNTRMPMNEMHVDRYEIVNSIGSDRSMLASGPRLPSNSSSPIIENTKRYQKIVTSMIHMILFFQSTFCL